jgi:hypothetical protein
MIDDDDDDEWSSQWKEKWQGKRKYSKKTCLCHFVHHKSHMN